jgi:monolysocardiolipin acyltransferase
VRHPTEQIHGVEKLVHAIRERPLGKPLVTVCNHVAAMDDPLVLAAVVPGHLILDAHPMRWTLCASDRCFKNPAMSAFFRAVKVLPVERGAGLEQKVRGDPFGASAVKIRNMFRRW